jgi:hypothetical protein
MGVALATMGEQFEALLDVTIAYPHGIPSFWDLISGRLDAVVVRVQRRELDADLIGGDLMRDKRYRVRVGRWIEQQWTEKDQLLGQLLGK